MSSSHSGAINEILGTLELHGLDGLDALVALTGAMVQASRSGLMPAKMLVFVPDIARVLASYVDASTDERDAVVPEPPCEPIADNTQT